MFAGPGLTGLILASETQARTASLQPVFRLLTILAGRPALLFYQEVFDFTKTPKQGRTFQTT